MPNTDGGETSGKHRNISPRSSSPVRQNIIHKTGRESLNQFILYYLLLINTRKLVTNLSSQETRRQEKIWKLYLQEIILRANL